MPPVIDETKCVACGYCATICPMRVFERADQPGQAPEVHYPEECWHCLACELDCKQQAIKVRLPLPLMMPRVEASTLRPAPLPETVGVAPACRNNAGGGHA